PEQTPRQAMPAHHRLRRDDGQVPAPVTAESADYDPEQLVAGTQPRSFPGWAGQYRELMTQQEVLGDERVTIAHGRADKVEQKQQILEYHSDIMPLDAHRNPGRLLHPHW